MYKLSIVFLLLILGSAFQLAAEAQKTNNSPSVSTNIPKPSGNYPTGTAIFQLTDSTRKDRLSKESNQFREIMIQFWYPAKPANKTETAPYIPDSRLLKVLKDEKYYEVEQSIIDGWKNIRTNSVLDAPISNRQSKFPLLLFSPGLGVSRTNYTMLAEELASYGYVVVCIDHPYIGVTVLPDGRVVSSNEDTRQLTMEVIKEVIDKSAKDALFVLDRVSSTEKSNPAGKFYKNIDWKRIGIMGHSLGGVSAIETCRLDNRFKACASLDGAHTKDALTGEGKTPTLILQSNPNFSDEQLAKRKRTREQDEKRKQGLKRMFSALLPTQNNVPGYLVSIKGTAHMSYSDVPFIAPIVITREGGQFIDSNRGFTIMSDYIRGFFDKYLKDKEKNALDEVNSPYSEITIDRYNN